MSSTHKETDIVREFFKRWPRFYYFVLLVFGPTLFVNLSARGFLKTYPRVGTTANIGSGARIIAPGVINVDATPYETVDVVALAEHLPFDDSSIARLVYDNVLEHISDPEQAISETARVLEDGGYAYFAVPFMYPFHASPDDYTRWTDTGLKNVFERHGLRTIKSGVRSGPAAVLLLVVAYIGASMFCFGNRRAYLVLLNVFIIALFPLKILDLIIVRLPFSEEIASILYVVVRKDALGHR